MSLWYRTGTVAVTNGQQAVVGAGTDWAAAKVAAGDSISLPDGRDYEVQSVNSATSITITTPYLGATAASGAYFIVPIATAARLVELSTQAATLVQQFADVVQQAGVGKFAAGALVANLFRPALRGIADDDSGWNWPGGNVLEQWQGGAKTANYAPDGTPSGAVWEKAPISVAVAAALANKAAATDLALRPLPGAAPDQTPRNRQLGSAAYVDKTWLHGSAAGVATAIAAAARPTVVVPVPGAELGDFVQVSLSVSAGGIEPRADVTAPGEVTVKEINPTASGITLGAHTVYVRVDKRIAE